MMSNERGFTRIEALSLAMVLALMVLIQISSQANIRSAGNGEVCQGNMRQLTLGWMLYAQDNDDRLVAAGRFSGNEPPDWTSGQWLDLPETKRESLDPWEPERGIANCPLWTYAGEDPRYWRCPDDYSTGSHPDYLEGAEVPRVRSYTMSCWAGGPAWRDGRGVWKVYQSLSDFVIPGPSETIVLLDEKEESLNDGYFAIQMDGFDRLNPMNPEAQMVDYPANRHANAGMISFADGHVENHAWVDPRTTPDVPPGQEMQLNVSSPDNPDIHWMQLHATRAKRTRVYSPHLRNPDLAGSTFSLSIQGSEGADFDIESSSDLTTWHPVGSVESLNGEMEVSDDQAGDHPHRFYRAKSRE